MELYGKGLYVADAADNVGTALRGAIPGRTACYGAQNDEIELLEAIPPGFKAAICRIPSGEAVVKYGVQIGIATKNIRQGEKVHLHNCESAYDKRSATLDPDMTEPTDIF